MKAFLSTFDVVAVVFPSTASTSLVFSSGAATETATSAAIHVLSKPYLTFIISPFLSLIAFLT